MTATVANPPAEEHGVAGVLEHLPFPTSWKASWSHWWSHKAASDGYTFQNQLIKRGLEGTGIELRDYDDTLLSDTSERSHQSAAEHKVARLRKIDVGGKNRLLNVLEVGPAERKPDEHAFVVLHGYGGALAFYWQNMAAMCSLPNTRIYFMDLLGMGLSSRPRFPTISIKGDPKSRENIRARVEEAENFFLDTFDDFAEKEKLKDFTMVGHSLGGYLSTAYALKRPEKVNRLILISPVGIPKSPYESDQEEEAKLGDNRAAIEQDADGPPAKAGAQDKLGIPGSQANKENIQLNEPKKLPYSSTMVRLWEANISPFSLIRFSSFAGPRFVSRYASRRFSMFEPNVQSELFGYLYSVYNQAGSGEYCLAHLLSPGAFARWPLITRIRALRGDIPVSFVYGDEDWMDKQGGKDICSLLKSRPESSQRVKDAAQVYVNTQAGHWTFLTNSAGMDKIMKKEMKEAIDNDTRR